MPHIHYLPDDQNIEADDAETILETSLVAGIPHVHVCGGSARCSTCRVWVIEGLELCAPRNDAEQRLAQRLYFDPRIRLACQTQVYGEGCIKLRRLAFDNDDADLISRQIEGKMGLGAIGEEKLLAILFADLRGFTSFAEALPPYDVIYVLNRYYSRMGKIMDTYGGLINNYMGDGLLAFFEAELPEQSALMAVRAALEMTKAMDTLNAYVESLYQRRLQIGIGIHVGQAVLGAVGANERDMRITAIGDAVNYASRIEAATKRVGANILISEETFRLVYSKITVGHEYRLEIPGKSGKYGLYEVLDVEPATMAELAIASQPLPNPQSCWIRIKRFLFWLWRSTQAWLKRHLRF